MSHPASRPFLALSLGVLTLLGSGCTSGSASGDPAMTLAVTDAASDELVTFIVQLKSFRLERTVGGVVSLLPDPVGVNFAELTDLSRVLNVSNVPVGVYTGAQVTLNFTNATAVVVGNPTEATILDSEGAPLSGDLLLPIEFAQPLVVSRGRNHVMELDFELNQSVQVDSGLNQVTVEPSLTLRIDPSGGRELAIGGNFKDVDLAGGTLRMGLPASPGDPIPLISVSVDASTVFQIDGVASLGSVGLAALENQLPVGGWVQAFGVVSPGSARFLASTVEAGRGSYNGGNDIIDGHVVQRIGNQLTVLGHSNNSNHTTFQYNRSFTVNVGPATRIVRRGSTQAYDLADLNVGQNVRLFGVQVNGTTMDADTAQDVVRVQPSRLLGFVSSAPSAGLLTLDLERVDLRLEGEFTWGDGGTTPLNPAALEAQIGMLDTLGVGEGMSPTPVALTGFFTATDDDSVDFQALTLENRSLSSSLVVLHDRTGGLSVMPSFDSDAISFAITGSATTGELLLLDRGFVGTTVLPTSPAPRIEARFLSGAGFYTVRDRTTGAVATHLDFADFSAYLESQLNQGAVLFNVGAVGVYDDVTNTIGCALVSVVIE